MVQFSKGEISSLEGKKRTCYNCNEENHFASECPYEKREDKPKFEKKETRLGKKLPNPLNKGKGLKKKEGKAFVGTTYMSDDSDDDEEEDDEVVGVAGVAKLAKSNSLFKYDYSKDYKGKNHMCLMAKGDMVNTNSPHSTLIMPHVVACNNDDSDDEEEALLIEMHKFMSSLKGKALAKFQFLMDTIVERNETIEELENLITEDKRRFQLLEQELTEEKIKTASLALSIETYQLDHVKNLDNLEKSLGVIQELNASKEELKVANASLTKDIELLEGASKSIKIELVNLSEKNEQLRTHHLKTLATPSAPIVVDMNACATNSLIKQASLVEENKRLKAQLEKGMAKCAQGKKNLDEVLSHHKATPSSEGTWVQPKKQQEHQPCPTNKFCEGKG